MSISADAGEIDLNTVAWLKRSEAASGSEYTRLIMCHLR
jgi:hypothetical protein